MVTSCDIATTTVLQTLANKLNCDRTYVFYFSGSRMTNTHEYVAPGVAPYKDAFDNVDCSALPFFVPQLRKGKAITVSSHSDLPDGPAAPEKQEMQKEGIQQLALVPFFANKHGVKVQYDSDDVARHVSGFIGVDVCCDDKTRDAWSQQQLEMLGQYGEFLVQWHRFTEVASQNPVVPSHRNMPWRIGPSRRALQVYSELQENFPDLTSEIMPHVMGYLEEPARCVVDVTTARSRASHHFRSNRYAILNAEVYHNNALQSEYEAFRQEVLKMVHTMPADIEPYTRFRSVGYGRYTYRNGSIMPLKHKPFFQVDPKAHVFLKSKPRPFARLDDSVREHPVLYNMLRVLLEDVWSNELGPEVHINVHPLIIRNYHEGVLHNEVFTTLEGTHTDSTMRVAVVLLDRHNVKKGTASTALYDPRCPIGKRRCVPEDEAEIKPHRLHEVTLMEPFDTITFDDNCFKHDASDPVPEVDGLPMFRSVMLIMCRVPCVDQAPVGEGIVDGHTPRTPK